MVSGKRVGTAGDSRTAGGSGRTTGRMWIRTYRVDATGRPLGDAEPPAEYAPVDPVPLASGSWPPCACPRHLALQE